MFYESLLHRAQKFDCGIFLKSRVLATLCDPPSPPPRILAFEGVLVVCLIFDFHSDISCGEDLIPETIKEQPSSSETITGIPAFH